MNITIIGTGAYSLSIAKRLSKNEDNKIKLWTEDRKKEKEFKDTRKIKSIFANEVFDENIEVTANYEYALKDTNVIFIMTTSNFVKQVSEIIKLYYKSNIPVVIGTKGLDTESNKYPSQIVKKCLHTSKIAVIAGPSFAIDILNDQPLALTVATKKRSIYKLLQTLFKDQKVTLERSNDLMGVQLCSTLKNVYAIGSGILKGLGYPTSTQSIYLTKIVKELNEILYMFDSNEFTLFSLAGIGDLLMTCSDEKSRNYTYGTKLSSKSKKDVETYLNKNTVEGYNALSSIYNQLKKKRAKAPIIKTIYEIVFEDKDAKELEKELGF